MKNVKIYSPLELRSWRSTEGLTQRQLAVIMGYHKTYDRMICLYESGNVNAIPAWRAWERLNAYIDADRVGKQKIRGESNGKR